MRRRCIRLRIRKRRGRRRWKVRARESLSFDGEITVGVAFERRCERSEGRELDDGERVELESSEEVLNAVIKGNQNETRSK